MTDPTFKHDAREFGLHLAQGGWRMGLLVARNVVRAPGRVALATLAPKTNATQFAKIANTSNDRVLRYLDAWQLAARAGKVPDASTLQPGVEIELDTDALPHWAVYLARAQSNQRQATAVRRAAELPPVRPLTSGGVVVDEAPPTREEIMVAEALADQLRIARPEETARARAAALSALIENGQDMANGEAALRSALDERIIERAGADERARAGSSPRETTAPLSATERRQFNLDLDREAYQLILALRSYTRRLFDVARDRNWIGERADRALDVGGLIEQLTLVSAIVVDPDAGHVTDDALNKLLNGN